MAEYIWGETKKEEVRSELPATSWTFTITNEVVDHFEQPYVRFCTALLKGDTGGLGAPILSPLLGENAPSYYACN
jgi:hypothetical protein